MKGDPGRTLPKTGDVARTIAAHWGECRHGWPCPVHLDDIADQAQELLDAGHHPVYLLRVAGWMAVHHHDWFDLSLAMTMSGAPKPS